MLAEIIKDLLQQNLPRLRTSGNGWKTCNCPFCSHLGHRPDTRSRFGIIFNSDTVSLHCFNCAFKTKFTDGQRLSKKMRWALEILGVPKIDIAKLDLQARAAFEGNPVNLENKFSVSSLWTPIDKPDTFLSISDWIKYDCQDDNFLKTKEYAVSRGITDLSSVMWTPDTDTEMNKRLIIPFYYNDRFIGYTGRYFEEKTPKKSLRYFGYTPKNFVYNYSRQYDYDREIVLVFEGVLNALLTDGVALLSKEIKHHQIESINKLNKRVIFCPDRDKNGDETIESAIKAGWEVSNPKWDSTIKDSADAIKKYGTILTIKSILDSAERSAFRIRFKRKTNNTYGE